MYTDDLSAALWLLALERVVIADLGPWIELLVTWGCLVRAQA